MEHKEDGQYIKRVLNGETNAYAFLVNKYKPMVFSLALRMLKNREDAEEVAQDAFVKAYQSLSQFRGGARFSTWLYRIVYNTAVSRFRRSSYEVLSIDDKGVEEKETDEIAGKTAWIIIAASVAVLITLPFLVVDGGSGNIKYLPDISFNPDFDMSWIASATDRMIGLFPNITPVTASIIFGLLAVCVILITESLLPGRIFHRR